MVLCPWSSTSVVRQAELSVHLLPQQQHGFVISKVFLFFLSPPRGIQTAILRPPEPESNKCGLIKQDCESSDKDTHFKVDHWVNWRHIWMQISVPEKKKKTPLAVSKTTIQLFFKCWLVLHREQAAFWRNTLSERRLIFWGWQVV